MTQRPKLTKAERMQVEAADYWCSELGLAPGVFSRGGKHGRYSVTLPGGRTLELTVACTPRDADEAVKIMRKNFRKNVAIVMGAAG
jgi:hypothetical protein